MQFSASLNHLYDMLSFVRQQAVAAGFEQSRLHQIELALEEAIVNIVRYSGLDAHHQISITTTSLDAPGIQITIRDDGVPYDPLSKAPQTESEMRDSVEAKKLGGYGIYLILKLMDRVSYKRDGNSNVLTLVKYI